MQTQRAIINISVPQAMAKQIEALAKKENKTKSELFREAFRSYKRRYEFDKEWAKIRSWGDEVAKRMNIKTEEDVERIAG